VIFRGVLLATNIVWLVLELRQATRRRAEAVRVGRDTTAVLIFTVVIGFGGAFVAVRSAPAATIDPRAAGDWAGVVLIWLGVALRVWSFQTLGRYFTFRLSTSADQPVITSGPYRVVRHPSYSGLLLAFMGVGLTIGNWISFASLTIGTLFGLAYRIWVEELALTQALGERYLRYKATVRRRLIPYVW